MGALKMKLDINDLRELTLGAVKVENRRDSFQFYRFNEEEMAYYAPTNHIQKSYATAGIEICALTDAKAVYILGKLRPGSSRSYYSFDILSDGVLVGEIKNFSESEMIPDYTEKPFDLGEFSGRVELPDGPKTLRIVFPWSVAVDLYEVELVGASYIEKVNTERRMLIYGDSITQGYDAENPSRSYASRIARALNANAINKGIGGEKFAPALAAIKNDPSPDLITVAYGTNDWVVYDIEKIAKLCEEFYTALSKNYPNAKIFALAPIWRGMLTERDAFDSFMRVSKIISAATEKLDNVIFVEGIDHVPHDNSYYADLNLHPRNIGFDHYADNIIDKIKSMLGLSHLGRTK